MEGQHFTYSAFISYKHLDKQHAKWIQKRLERYRLPAKLCKQFGLSRRLQKCFRDVDDLAGTMLKESISEEMAKCRFMILVCSPNVNIEGEYINYEVETFKKLRGEQYIIPVIVDGAPDHPDPSMRCFPTALTDGSTEYLGVSFEQDGKNKAILKIIATILDLSADTLIMRERRRQIKNRLITGGAVAAAGAIALGTWLYTKPYEQRYLDYVLHYNQPKGIHELTAAQAAKEDGHYIITTQMGKTIETEYVNSSGVLTAFSSSYSADRPERAVYSYVGDTINTVEYYNEHNDHVSTMQFQGTPETVLFYSAFDPNDPYRLASDIDRFYEEFNHRLVGYPRSSITGYEYTYNDDGTIKTAMFLRTIGIKACTEDLIYGFSYQYDELGRIAQRTYLDAQGNPRADASQVCTIKYTYSDSDDGANINRLSKVEYLDIDGNPTANGDGYATVTIFRNDTTMRHEFFDEHGTPTANQTLGASIQSVSLDEQGRVSSAHLQGEDGQPRTGNDFTTVTYQYDQDGRVSTEHFSDANAVAVKYNDEYHTRNFEYTEDGRYFAITQYPGLSGSDVSALRTEYSYDEQGNITQKAYLNESGEPQAYFDSDYAYERYTYENGKLVSITYYDAENKPVMRRDEGYSPGFFEERYEYADGALSPSSVTYYGTDGNAVDLTLSVEDGMGGHILLGGYSTIKIYYDDGRMSQLESYFADGSPADMGSGFYKTVSEAEYLPDNRLMESLFFYDVNDEIIDENYTIDYANGTTQEESGIRYSDGQKVSGYAVFYDEGGVLKRREGYEYIDDQQITTLTILYDEYGRDHNVTSLYVNEMGDTERLNTLYTYYDDGSQKSSDFTAYSLDDVLLGRTLTEYYMQEDTSAQSGSSGQVMQVTTTIYDTSGTIESESAFEYYPSGETQLYDNKIYSTDGILIRHSSLHYREDGVQHMYQSYSFTEQGLPINEYTSRLQEDEQSNLVNLVIYDNGILLSESNYITDLDGEIIERLD